MSFVVRGQYAVDQGDGVSSEEDEPDAIPGPEKMLQEATCMFISFKFLILFFLVF